MEAYDDYGNFIFDLSPENLRIIEDGYELPAMYTSVSEPGLQTILAINEAPMMTYQYSGISYYEHLRSGLSNWLATRAENNADLYSLVTNPGPQAVRVSSASQFHRLCLTMILIFCINRPEQQAFLLRLIWQQTHSLILI